MEVTPSLLSFGRLKRGYAYALELRIVTPAGQSVEVSVAGGLPACLKVEADTWVRPGVVRVVFEAHEAGAPLVGSIRCFAGDVGEVTVPVSVHVLVDPETEAVSSYAKQAVPGVWPEVMSLQGPIRAGAARVRSQAAGSRLPASRPAAAARGAFSTSQRPLRASPDEATSTPAAPRVGGWVTGGAGADPAGRPADDHLTEHADAVMLEERTELDQRTWWVPYNGSFDTYLVALQRSLAAVRGEVQHVQGASAQMRTLYAALESSAHVLEAVRTGSRQQRDNMTGQAKVPRQIAMAQAPGGREGGPKPVLSAAARLASQEAATSAAIAVMQQRLEEVVDSNQRMQLAVAEEHEMRTRVEQERNVLRAELFVLTRARDEEQPLPSETAALREAAEIRDLLEEAQAEVERLGGESRELKVDLSVAERELEAFKKGEVEQLDAISDLQLKVAEAQDCAQWQEDATLLLARLRSWGLRADVARRIPQAEMLFTQVTDQYFGSEREDWLGSVAILLEQTERLLNQYQTLPEQDKPAKGSEALVSRLKLARLDDLTSARKLLDMRKWLSRTLAAKHVENMLHLCWRGWLSHTLQAKKARHADSLIASSGERREAEQAKQAQAAAVRRLERELEQARAEAVRDKEAGQKLRDGMVAERLKPEERTSQTDKAAVAATAAAAAASSSADVARALSARLAEKDAELSRLQGELARAQLAQQGEAERAKRVGSELNTVRRRAEEGERLLAVYHKDNMKSKGYDPVAAHASATIRAALNPTLRGGPLPMPAFSAINVNKARLLTGPYSAGLAGHPRTRPSSASHTKSTPWGALLPTALSDLLAAEAAKRPVRPQSAAVSRSSAANPPRPAPTMRPQSAALARR